MKDKIIKLIREVPIADKYYPEYVESVAEHLIENGMTVNTVKKQGKRGT